MANEANEMFERLSRELNMSASEMKSSCERGDTDALLKNVDSDKAKQVEAILADPERTKALLSSPEAQALMKLFGQQ